MDGCTDIWEHNTAVDAVIDVGIRYIQEENSAVNAAAGMGAHEYNNATQQSLKLCTQLLANAERVLQ